MIIANLVLAACSKQVETAACLPLLPLFLLTAINKRLVSSDFKRLLIAVMRKSGKSDKRAPVQF